jgi:hypothetical protein
MNHREHKDMVELILRCPCVSVATDLWHPACKLQKLFAEVSE